MAQGTEVEGVALRNYNILVAHAHCDPVGVALADLEVEDLAVAALLQTRLHDGELVARGVLRFDVVVSDQLDVGVLEDGGEFESGSFLPHICFVHRLFQSLLVLFQLLVDLQDVARDHFVDLLVAELEAVDELGLSHLGLLFSLLLLVWDHSYQLLDRVFELLGGFG